MLGKFEENNIYNEDCYNAIKEIPDKSIDCIYVDIPYLYNQGGRGNSELSKHTMNKKNELKEIENGIDYSIFNEFCRVNKKINIFIWCSKLQIPDILNYFISKYNDDIFYEILTWHKSNPMPTTRNTWLPDTEYCLYFRQKGVLLNDGFELKSKWYLTPINANDKGKFAHPTIKPLELVKRHLLHTTQPNDLVLDCFIGSGTTAVACKSLGRRYLGFEIDKKWYDIAKDRLNNIDANGQISFIEN